MYKVAKMYIGNNVYLINEIKYIPHAKESYSQFGQDDYVFTKLFKNKTNGIFVDVGGNHPVKCNNTYLLEKNGWNGIAIEPQDELRKLWPQNRKAQCLDYVIGPEGKEVTFIEGMGDEHGVSGIKGFNKVSTNNGKEIIKKQRRLDEILIENNLTNVDYLSIDVEGYEMSVLESIDFNKINIKILGVENDLGFDKIPFIGKKLGSELGNKEIRQYLKDKGYKYVGRIICDDFFIKI